MTDYRRHARAFLHEVIAECSAEGRIQLLLAMSSKRKEENPVLLAVDALEKHDVYMATPWPRDEEELEEYNKARDTLMKKLPAKAYYTFVDKAVAIYSRNRKRLKEKYGDNTNST